MKEENNLTIRKLTPLECWRLMGICDQDFYKAQKVSSDTQLYKQAGNAIVVDVLQAIFSNMFNQHGQEGQLTIEDYIKEVDSERD